MTINNCFKVRVRDIILSAAAGLCLAFALPAQATTLKILKRFDATNSASFLQNDWNPANGNTHWGAIALSQSNEGIPTDYMGTNVAGSFSVGEDPWETVSIKSIAGQQFDLRGTQEIQLVARPQYVTDRPYVTIVLRLAMQDGSIWDQPKVMANNVWQTAAFPVKEDSFFRAEWGPAGAFDLGRVASWEVILVDLPPGNHAINFHTLYMKGDYTPAGSVAEPFGVNLSLGDGSILFRRADWNPVDGDTDWLYHVRTHPHYYNPYGASMRAFYRSGGDPWETVSLRKEAQTYFDLTASGSGQIVAQLGNAGPNFDPNALVMSLTMEDGSVWQQGKPLDLVSSTGYTYPGSVGEPYRFSLDPQGKGWIRAGWGPAGNFDLSRIKAWELSFNNLGEGENSVLLGSIELMEASSLVKADNTFGATGQAQWLERRFASDGMVADISSDGLQNSLYIASETPINGLGLGFNLEIASSYANSSPDAVVFKLTTGDGTVWQQSFALPEAGRSIRRIYTSCPAPIGMIRPDPDDMRCKFILGTFYGITSDIKKWEVVLNRPPAGEHKIQVNLLSTVQ